MDNSPLSNAIFISPDYLLRYFFYTDYTRQQAVAGVEYWADKRVVSEMQFGIQFRMGKFQPVFTEAVFVIANHPQLHKLYDEKRKRMIEVLDVFFAPAEQWMLYEHQEPVDWEVEILYVAEENDQ